MSRRSRGFQSSGYPSPQSAQPYKSIFGGQSQNEDIDLSTLPDPVAAAEESDVGDSFDYEPLPPMSDDSDDDPDYDDRSVARSSRASRSAKKSKSSVRDKGKKPMREPNTNSQRSKSSDARSRSRRGSSTQASVSESGERGSDILWDEELYDLRTDDVVTDVARTTESPISYRPNRFTGAPSTWRKYTESERRIAQSLEDMRARDLFVHLYNAFALKQRARRLREENPDGSEYWDTVSGVRVPTKPFEPNSRWTAWPMPADEVPRTEYEALPADAEEGIFKRQPDTRPSSDLEEEIMAVMMRTAKERILERKWKFGKRHRNCQQGRDESAKPDVTDYDDEPRPLVQADDDLAQKQLLPEVRNIVTSLERVLNGLHEDRYTFGTSAVPSRRTSRIRSDGSHGTSSAQRRGRTASQKAPRARKLTNAKWANVIKAPRRWHDILGVALMSGIPESVVQRAAERCAELFGGSTEIFQPLREGRVKRVIEEDEDGRDISTWEFVLEESPSESETEEPANHPLAWLLPEVQDATESESEKTVSKKSAPKSLPSQESSSLASSAAPSSTPAPTHAQPPGKRRKKTREELVCPTPDCPRHVAGFSRTWNLNLHLRRVHSGYEKPT